VECGVVVIPINSEPGLLRAGGHLYVVTGPNGTGITRSLAKLCERHPQFQVVKLEDHLLRLAVPTYKRLFGDVDGISQIEMFRLPEAILRDLWAGALEAAADEATAVRKSGKAVFLNLHATWYHVEARAFMSAVDHPALEATLVAGAKQAGLEPPSAVLTLIDDVFDTCVRLTRRHEVFGDEGRTLSTLLKILTWREFEVRSAERIAQTLSRPQLLLPVKHPESTFLKILGTDVTPRLSYLSHPIYYPRQCGLDSTIGGEVVGQVEAIASQLRQDLAVALLEPTCIDEQRLTFADRSATGLPRWPLPNSRGGILLWDHLEDEDGRTRAEELAWASQPTVACDEQGFAIIRDLIGDHVTWRDRQMVTQSSAVIVVRPYCTERGELAGGVEEELRLYNLLLTHDPTSGRRHRPIAYLDPTDEHHRRVSAVLQVLTNWSAGRGSNPNASLEPWNDSLETEVSERLDRQTLASWFEATDQNLRQAIETILTDSASGQPAPTVRSASHGIMAAGRAKTEVDQLWRELVAQIRESIRGDVVKGRYNFSRELFLNADIIEPPDASPEAVGRRCAELVKTE
jgi:hypothetical protein